MKFDEDDDLCKGCKLFQYIHFIFILLTFHVIFVMKEKYLSFLGCVKS